MERARRPRLDRWPHIVHLSDLALEVLEQCPQINGSSYVFTANGTKPWSNYFGTKLRLQKLMGSADDWVPHDLRRTTTTVLAELGVAPHVADRILNHQSGTIAGVAAVRFQYLQERQAALEELGRYVARLVGRDVVPLREQG
jgi:integrase